MQSALDVIVVLNSNVERVSAATNAMAPVVLVPVHQLAVLDTTV